MRGVASSSSLVVLLVTEGNLASVRVVMLNPVWKVYPAL